MARTILIKPILTEKANTLTEKRGTYSFMVDKKANKIEIKKAVEKMYNVSVDCVNTMVMPSKVRNRNTKSGVIRGSISSYKKALVTLATGENIDFYGAI